ncbi:unnamed protein product, partial [Brassica napus]
MASSSSLCRSWLYHVFVSFRGEDVRKGFLSHVLKELKSKGIIPFVDNEIKRGESVVASDVTDVLGFTPSKDFDEFVGIGAQITEIKSKLILQSEQVKVIGVVGPPGIGKTTTARVLYNQLSPGFPFSTFFENIRGKYEKPCGNDYSLKLRVAQNMLSDKKVLAVLDEVDNWWQLEE